ncbi:MAG: hypothetical protein HY708_00860, partial [Ignavibacteriae bacterium]|nr:hypothetical protein [Ignavibacteriota bacterium]
MFRSKQGNTKIVATLGPSTSSVEMLVQLIQSGVSVTRLNFSHGSYEDHRTTLRNLQEAAKK